MSEKSHLRVGVYVDVSNMGHNGGYGMQYDVLREFACRDGAEPLRLNAYAAYDPERARTDPVYRNKIHSYFSVLREFGYKIVRKEVRWHTDEAGNRFSKANADLDMAVDALLQSEHLDRVLLVTGDGDFTQLVRALQNKGLRVEVVAFENVSALLRREADVFISGFLIPELLPYRSNGDAYWGEIGSRVRGYCCHHDDQKGYGFMRYLESVSTSLWVTDTRRPDSPYKTAFFHDSHLPEHFDASELPSRTIVFEFTLADSGPDKGPGATQLKEVWRY